MTIDDNKQAVRRFFEAVSAGDMAALDEILGSPEYRLHFDSMPEMDSTQALAFFGDFVSAFPGIDHHILDQIAEGDEVATRITVRGVNTGPLMGMPPTGRSLEIGAINIHRFAYGEIIEQWVHSDTAATLIQLGVFPPSGT